MHYRVLSSYFLSLQSEEMLISGRLVEVTEGAFERKMRENREKSGLGLFLENPREVEKTLV